MRLLQIEDNGSLSLQEYISGKIPPYAILSHTWSRTDKEVTYSAFISGDYKKKNYYHKSYEKIRSCGKQTKADGLQHFWIDTCCIDKESSAELSEAINSMYAWYQQADICYAYLDDMHEKDDFGHSRWFTRGWTLQELMAPADVQFFNAAWSSVGFKTSLTSMLSSCTGIDSKALADGTSLDIFSVAERMSWAANRNTTRIEDEAYCLFGLFDINMPLIYGEGRRAFVRLQEELLTKTGDASILAYMALQVPAPKQETVTQTDAGIDAVASEVVMDEVLVAGTVGLLASSPTYYRNGAGYIPFEVETHSECLGQDIRKSGRFVQLTVVLWQFPWEVLSNMSCMGESRIRDHVSGMSGITLTLSSIKKLCRCAESTDTADWVIAFIGCQRRHGGVLGMLLQRDVKRRGIFVRQHYPSIVETTSVESFSTRSVGECCNIEIEANILAKLGHTKEIEVTELEPPWRVRIIHTKVDPGPVFRTVNFERHGFFHVVTGQGVRIKAGFILQDEEIWYSFGISTLHIKLSREGDRRDRIFCAIFSEGYDGSKLEESRHFIPTSRGERVDIKLNNELWLVVKSQMQWEQEESLHDVNQVMKRCLLTLRIITSTEALDQGKSSHLQDPRAILKAISLAVRGASKHAQFYIKKLLRK